MEEFVIIPHVFTDFFNASVLTYGVKGLNG